MPEPVADPAAPEPQEPAEPAAPATPSAEDFATIQRRLAGKDQALTRTTQERDAAKAEADALKAWKAQREQADMTEVERLQAQLAAKDSELATARSEAQKERLARKFPLAVDFYGDEPLPSEEKLAALQERLSAKSDDETDAEPVIDPNSPQRQPKPKVDPVEAMLDPNNMEVRDWMLGGGR